LLIQVLNVGWSYFILKVAYQAMFSTGSIANDARSDDSSSEQSDDNDDKKTKTVKKMQ
jgi:hypothetical protein